MHWSYGEGKGLRRWDSEDDVFLTDMARLGMSVGHLCSCVIWKLVSELAPNVRRDEKARKCCRYLDTEENIIWVVS